MIPVEKGRSDRLSYGTGHVGLRNYLDRLALSAIP